MPDLSVWPTDGGDGSVSSEARWRKMGRAWVPSGVCVGLLDTGAPTGLAPSLVAGPTINVAAGSCWLDGHYAELVTPASVPASANGLLVVRFTPADNHAELLYRDAAVTCTQTLATWELPIAQMLAGALRDIRWYANTRGELAFTGAGATITVTPSHTQASPIDIDNLPAVYCDGSVLEVEATAFTVAGPASGAGLLRSAVWIDGAEAPNAGLLTSPLYGSYAAAATPGYGRARTQPAAGVHQIRARAFMAGATANAAVSVWHTLSVRRI